jgi:hypothetical protein
MKLDGSTDSPYTKEVGDTILKEKKKLSSHPRSRYSHHCHYEKPKIPPDVPAGTVTSLSYAWTQPTMLSKQRFTVYLLVLLRSYQQAT